MSARQSAEKDARCSCGNRFDGDNFCMVSACQWEGSEPDPDAFGVAGYLLEPRVLPPDSGDAS